MSEVDEKYDELRKKHGTNYTLEQLRMWEQRFGVDVNANKINILTHPHLNEYHLICPLLKKYLYEVSFWIN